MAKDYIKGTDSVPKVGRFGSNYSLIIHEGPCSTSLFRGLLFHADLLQMTKQTWGKSSKIVDQQASLRHSKRKPKLFQVVLEKNLLSRNQQKVLKNDLQNQLYRKTL